ncbi:MAG: ComF family protein [Parcubacteria group bacterium]|nr:ComF family protein [Parcubacteria group bacterium]
MLLTALFPRYCVGCERKDSALCDECISMIESAPIQQCVVCKKISPYGDICRPCRKNEILDISIDGLFYGFDYNNHVIEKIITAFKYRNNFKAIDMLYARFVELLERARFFEQFNEYVLSPMPLHRYHFNKRGFSQTDYLCEKLSRDFCIPIARPLVKIKNTPKQTKLKKEKRLENVRDVFETRDARNLPARLAGRRVKKTKNIWKLNFQIF